MARVQHKHAALQGLERHTGFSLDKTLQDTSLEDWREDTGATGAERRRP
jgi:hypothetical protein